MTGAADSGRSREEQSIPYPQLPLPGETGVAGPLIIDLLDLPLVYANISKMPRWKVGMTRVVALIFSIVYFFSA